MIEITDNYEIEMLDALKPADAARDMNGRAFYLFCLEAAKKGKPVLELTLGEVAELMSMVGEHYAILKTLEA